MRLLATSVLALGACGGAAPAPAGPRLGPAIAAVIAAADEVREPWRCSGELEPPPPEQLASGWALVGRTLTRAGKSRELVIGVVADAGGADPATIAALGRVRAKVAHAHASLVLALGGMGTTEPELEATLGALAGTWPVVALPGDLEGVTAEVAAIAALRARGTIVLDGRLVRWIESSGVAIATIPGAGSAARLVAGADGCAWRADEVTALYGELAARPGLRIAATAEAPREIVAGEATGELALAPGPAIDLVVHAPTRPVPSPPRTGGRDGRRVALSPGTADAAPRVPPTRGPSAGLLVIRGERWSWQPVTGR